MRFKYIVEKKDKNNALVLREYMETERDLFSCMNETVFDGKTLFDANKRGMKALLGVLRTNNFYPPFKFAEKIADVVSNMLKSKKNPSMEIILDDMDFIDTKQWRRPGTAPILEESIEVDEFIETDELMEQCSDDTCTINPGEESSDVNRVFPFDEVA